VIDQYQAKEIARKWLKAEYSKIKKMGFCNGPRSVK